MNKNKSKEKFMANPIERHDTAAWRGHIENVKPQSNVPIPSEESVQNAKEWVDTNSLS
ncbi:hypothetical protein Desor_4086 [Desulfosporosinus orientis DSM 765]|uniref:DUF3787 domain-containing protein n=1 Tax=Desulfosporosinus orientis (strain ATCC 19365 / DSM 765 / NCIMB 8382 / VKM B-1628 / Singapore I) TaxID=768706 RepID=G7WH19_DESOD|nr:DUF3787 domain-containing protein [Desulfosporosinus orientis]AET69527.1 hypothetical protein Desor_4086 [Desulfosporosinus orientis DSM 765]